jgi:hypothetical protein
MPPVGFEPIISAGKRPKTYALDRAATAGTGTSDIVCGENQNSRFIIKNFSEICTVYEIMCKNMVEADRLRTTI